jgi:hypothetical protein
MLSLPTPYHTLRQYLIETLGGDPLDPPLLLYGVAAYYKESNIDIKGGYRASFSKETL